jgi:hypothetical protein
MQNVQVNIAVPTAADVARDWYVVTGGVVEDVLASNLNQQSAAGGLSILVANVRELEMKASLAIQHADAYELTPVELTDVLEAAIDVVICTMVQFAKQDLPFDEALRIKMQAFNTKRIDAGLTPDNKLVKPLGYQAPNLFACFQEYVAARRQQHENAANTASNVVSINQATAEKVREDLDPQVPVDVMAVTNDTVSAMGEEAVNDPHPSVSPEVNG